MSDLTPGIAASSPDRILSNPISNEPIDQQLTLALKQYECYEIARKAVELARCDKVIALDGDAQPKPSKDRGARKSSKVHSNMMAIVVVGEMRISFTIRKSTG
jgi:hypothetical protein